MVSFNDQGWGKTTHFRTLPSLLFHHYPQKSSRTLSQFLVTLNPKFCIFPGKLNKSS